MDQKEMMRQSQVLRSKQAARSGRRPHQKVQVDNKGVAKLSRPLPPQSPPINVYPPTVAQIRKKRAERILAQRRQLLATKHYTDDKTDAPGKAASQTATHTRRGCSNCKRKRR